jgi:uncharacterized metal-binding protein YceD (DUF177 family)
MNKLAKASIIKGRSLSFSSSPSFEGYPLSYPIHKVEKCHYDVTILKTGDYAEATFHITAKLLVEDSRDAALFHKSLEIKESADILDEEDNAGEGLIVNGSEIDLDELALRLIVSSLPIKLTRDESPLPKSGKGFRVLSEDEYQKEKQEQGNPAFDSLKDFKVNDK